MTQNKAGNAFAERVSSKNVTHTSQSVKSAVVEITSSNAAAFLQAAEAASGVLTLPEGVEKVGK